ncbi:MAG: NeuD/PglB/VioB family sugar acetyltransferase [Anaerolineaceae bacterium]|nr:NeuD/PglB/VioB family sugar acetyltransferase [Anaerolineaceae bacterium]
MSKPVVIFGNGGLASVVMYYCKNAGIEVVGFTVDDDYHAENLFEGLPNVNFNEVDEAFSPTEHQMFIAIGASDLMGVVRKEKMKAAEQKGYKLFSNNFNNSKEEQNIAFGNNTLIMPDAKVDPFVSFGQGVIAWNGSIICHHTSVGDYCFIAPGATICGKVIIGEHCFIGSNSTIRDNIMISPRNIIGAGSVINRDTDPDSVYMPARSIKIIKPSQEVSFNGL